MAAEGGVWHVLSAQTFSSSSLGISILALHCTGYLFQARAFIFILEIRSEREGIQPPVAAGAGAELELGAGGAMCR